MPKVGFLIQHGSFFRFLHFGNSSSLNESGFSPGDSQLTQFSFFLGLGSRFRVEGFRFGFTNQLGPKVP